MWFMILAVCLAAQHLPVDQSPPGSLSGIVSDETGAPLSDARVSLIQVPAARNQRATTGPDGAFLFTALPLGRYIVTAERDGFAPGSAEAEVTVTSPGPQVSIVLKVAGFLGSVLVTGNRGPVRAAPSSITVSPRDVRGVAGGGENIFRVLQTLPGVAAVNDFDSRVAVRGGGPDQNLTLMDGVEVHNPYRLFGLTSAFNPETIANFELTAGGFNAKYGDRLSSILVVENRDGTMQKPFAGSTSLTFTDGNLLAEGRVPGLNKASFLVTARRTYYDLIADRIVDTDLPGFTDVQIRTGWEPMVGHRFALFGLGSREGADATFDGDEGSGERATFKGNTRNDLAAASWSALFGTRVSNVATVSWYRNQERLNFDGDFRDSTRRSNTPDDADATPLTGVVFTRNLTIQDVAVRNELTVARGATHVFDAGFDVHALTTKWTWRIPGARNGSQANGSSVQGGVGLPSVLDSTRATTRAAAWMTDRWTVVPGLKFEPGVRLDWSGLAGEAIVSPRAALTLDVSSRTRLRLSGGRFTQSPGYEKLLQSDYFVDLSDADTLNLTSERAWHLVAGLERTIAAGTVARVEGYYKRFTRLIIGELETDDARRARIATYDFPAAFAASVPTAPQITSIPGNGGTGRAFGVEVYVAKRATSAATRLTGWLSYETGRAESTAYGRTYRSDYDRPHAFNLVASYRLSRLLEFATTMRAQSGFPETNPVGLRVAGVEDVSDADHDGNITELVPQRDGRGLPVWTVDYGSTKDLNAGRLPVFARVDVRLSFRPQWQNSRWHFYLEVINLLDRKNASALEPTLAYDPTSDRPSISMAGDIALPRLPSFGVRFRW